jgi:cellulose synthase/poly-beta-1,6-N-acetylglucosamine synthase-like glycosyltransferase
MMIPSYLSYLLLVCGSLLVVMTLPLILELLVLTIAALWPKVPVETERAGSNVDQLTVLIPAHNEEALIGRAIQSVLQSADSAATKVLVVAHNCTDATAAKAKAAGASVLVLDDSTRSGKGYALSEGFRAALAGNSQAVLVMDADSLMDANLIAHVRRQLQAGARALQCRYEVNNSHDSARTKLMSLAFFGMNVIRPRGRARLGFSAGIVGNGFVIHRDVLTLVPYGSHSIVEDVEYHLALLRAGIRVRFIDTAGVRGEMPATGKSSRTQRARWEGGRIHLMQRWAPKLLVDLLRGRVSLLGPLFDLLALPMASEVILLLMMACLPFLWIKVYVLAGFAVLIFHVTAVAIEGPGLSESMKALSTVPAYILWKLWIFPEIWRTSRADAKWVRTDREPVPDSK